MSCVCEQIQVPCSVWNHLWNCKICLELCDGNIGCISCYRCCECTLWKRRLSGAHLPVCGGSCSWIQVEDGVDRVLGDGIINADDGGLEGGSGDIASSAEALDCAGESACETLAVYGGHIQREAGKRLKTACSDDVQSSGRRGGADTDV